MSFLSYSTCLAVLAAFSLYNVVDATPSSGCGKSLPNGLTAGGASQRFNLNTTDGLNRTYLLYIPKLYSQNTVTPLVINYHGRGSNGADQEQLTGMSTNKWNNASIVAYPDGVDAQWQGDPDAPSSIDDVAFTQQLVENIAASFCVDTSRLYAVGSSNGGGFVGNYLGCSDYGTSAFAVFGAAYGAFYTENSDNHCTNRGYTPMNVPITCATNKTNLPFIEFHGTGDDTIPYDGGERRGFCLPAVPHFVTNWATRTGLASKNASQSLFSKKAFKYQFGQDTQLGQVTHYEIIGMAHTWPTIQDKVSPFDATPVLMEFFSKWGPGDGKAYVNPTSTAGSPTATGTGTATGTASTATGTGKSAASGYSAARGLEHAFTLFSIYILSCLAGFL